MKTSLRKILFILIPLSLLLLSFNCTGDDDDIDCEACIQAQIELCEVYQANNCKGNTDEAQAARQKVIDKCPYGADKAKYALIRCGRANTTGECEDSLFNCE